MIKTHLILAAALSALLTPLQAADLFLVQDGQPRAEIVIAETPQRSVRLAAQELQDSVEKISGAKLPIALTPSADVPVQIYVGRSVHTDRLNVTADGLQHGAYRIVSGDHWLVLIGEDSEFTPIEPWARNNAEIVNGKAQREWNQITGAEWGIPNLLIYKDRMTLPGDFGLPDDQRAAAKAKRLEIWAQDERGSFNAVCGFLRSLGMRWYLPGELGEVVPSLKSIPLPQIDRTERPDFPIRRFNMRFATNHLDTVMWAMRLGLRDPYGIEAAHGLDAMTNREEVFAAHPDWFALYGGKRNFQPRANNQLCYSNDELFRETVRYVRAQFDQFKVDVVSVMPPDGYTSICQCKLCEGQDSPERDQRGLLSDYVWDFVNRVAREVRKTHPDKKILNCAYGVYTLPPLKIERLEPNVMVSIVGGRRPLQDKPQGQEEARKLREDWVAKTSNPIIVFENYPFTDRGWYLPFFVPHTLGSSINATKGISQGEDIWLTVRQDFGQVGIGFNHFLVYFTQRMYWGGPEQDVDAMFREYCRLFYGPAEEEMLAFFGYCESNWQEMEKDKAKSDTALSLFAKAQAKADANSVYGKRIALIDDFLKGLRSKSTQLGRKRGPVPVLRLVGEATHNIVIDGKLDEEAWEKCQPASTVHLRELQTGRQPTFGTTVKSAWLGNNVYFAIRCDEHRGEQLNIGTTKKDDSALWYGDVVEILLETDAKSYYQIAISPSGAIADLDRSAPRNAWFSWDSQAEVATHVGDDHWDIEIRIPVIQDENDPLHQVIGRKPTRSLPWSINVCRQRIRENGEEYSAFSPTSADHFHEVMKFAHFFDGNSYQFDAAEPDADYLEASRAATALALQGKRAEALAAFTAAAKGQVTELQKSAALEQAAASARHLGQHNVAAELAAGIPIEAVKKTVLMQNLLDQYKAPQVIEQFGQEDIAAWPFWKSGDGYFARGRAYAITKAGQEAERDLVRALEWTSDSRVRGSIWQTIGSNRESNVKDDSAALAAYHEVIGVAQRLGSADQFTALQSIARIQSRRGQHDDALTTLRKVDIDKMRGYWRGSLLLTVGDTQLAAGQKDEALATYKSILADESTESTLRKLAEEKIAATK
ncbi:MAG TPA: DUF4838 domain-containing protein [Planctomycetaceae bacterium]|nr:DUF4838 domain-containing protein [Planctomycetaceae bacterium]